MTNARWDQPRAHLYAMLVYRRTRLLLWQGKLDQQCTLIEKAAERLLFGTPALFESVSTCLMAYGSGAEGTRIIIQAALQAQMILCRHRYQR